MGKIKSTRIMMATVHHMTSSSGLKKFQAAWFLLNRGYHSDKPAWWFIHHINSKHIWTECGHERSI